MNEQARAAASPGEDWPTPLEVGREQALAHRALDGQAVPIGERLCDSSSGRTG